MQVLLTHEMKRKREKKIKKKKKKKEEEEEKKEEEEKPSLLSIYLVLLRNMFTWGTEDASMLTENDNNFGTFTIFLIIFF